MKKAITLLCFSLSWGIATFAQTNLNFESWNGNEASGWVSSNPITQAAGGAQTVFKESTNPAEGSFSVRMLTGSCPDCPNFAIFGPFGPPTPLPNPFGGGIQLGSFEDPGIAYSQRPISVDFRYKANPGNGDACGFQVELTRYNASTDEDETIGEGYFEVTADVANWTSVNIPIVYYSDQTPDRLNIWATSSIGSIPDLSAFGVPALPVPDPVAGSEFWIDAIVLNLPSCDDFTISMSGSGESSIGAMDGSATVSPNGGTGPYSYSWSNLENSQTITGLIPGPYVVTVTDANQCQRVGTYYVAPGGCNLTLSITGSNSSTNSIYSGNGSASVNASGGSGSYTYLWNTGSTSSSISNLPVGTYAVLVSETNNPLCAAWAYFTVYGPDGPVAGVTESPENHAVFLTYPNPAEDVITMQSESDIRSVEIVDAMGALVFAGQFNNGRVSIDTESFTSGMYFYTVKNENGDVMSGRFIRK